MSNEPRNDMERVFGRPIGRGLVERGTIAQPPLIADDVAVVVADLLPRHTAFTATIASGGAAVLVDVADATGPNGQRTFIIEVREV
jgi:hypothetical protein